MPVVSYFCDGERPTLTVVYDEQGRPTAQLEGLLLEADADHVVLASGTGTEVDLVHLDPRTLQLRQIASMPELNYLGDRNVVTDVAAGLILWTDQNAFGSRWQVARLP